MFQLTEGPHQLPIMMGCHICLLIRMVTLAAEAALAQIATGRAGVVRNAGKGAAGPIETKWGSVFDDIPNVDHI